MEPNRSCADRPAPTPRFRIVRVHLSRRDPRFARLIAAVDGFAPTQRRAYQVFTAALVRAGFTLCDAPGSDLQLGRLPAHCQFQAEQRPADMEVEVPSMRHLRVYLPLDDPAFAAVVAYSDWLAASNHEHNRAIPELMLLGFSCWSHVARIDYQPVPIMQDVRPQSDGTAAADSLLRSDVQHALGLTWM